ncbi:hypothetical protein Pryu01_00156 [Paraliobacillus ryukyuensis]|uniref:Coupling factor for flagellin transcription and translation n=1 Tax=Paraliobacillus ryukyuensis TaxID=200904 RepID=A0A366EH87_9BACI|nr:hypothetical protein [Paraliobacillus ryukyuensis]RBP01772.1 hypothetical protein DES48_101516 [Paraliobacillus ryukyuensis]
MIYLLLFISFIIHIITFIYIKTVRNGTITAEEMSQQQEEQRKEIQELLAVYLVEIREENEKLIEVLEDKPNQKTKHPLYTQNKTEEKPSASQDTNREDSSSFLSKDDSQKSANQKSATNDYQPPSIEQVEDTFVPSLSAQVLSLYSKGESIESIARKLDCGKTEVELMVKFQQKNM